MQTDNVNLTVNGNRKLKCPKGSNLFKVLSDAGYMFSGNCGGRGMCERCLVYISGIGSVKSCGYIVMSDIDVTVKKDNTSILTGYQTEDGTEADAVTFQSDSDPDALGIAVDLGTTTVAMELVQLTTGATISQHGFLNPQIRYGSDVISRIKKGSTRDGLEELEKAIKSGLADGISSMTDHPEHISKMVISGNTTMNSILEDMTLENLGHFPFEIKNPDVISMNGEEFFGDKTYSRMTVICLPNLSAFVGADALCGALVCGLDRSDSYQLFADLGTNGELILAKRTKGYATSCACGPAFEGMLKRESVMPTTAFDFLYTMKNMKIVSDEGVLADRFITSGYSPANGVRIDMDMIHSFLLAKAAICAGIDALIDMAGISAEDISGVHIAGGFGCSLKINSATGLGLFPDCFGNKSEFAGNSSLHGAHKCLLDDAFIDRINEFKSILTAVNLGELDGFDRKYYSHMDLRSWDI